MWLRPSCLYFLFLVSLTSLASGNEVLMIAGGYYHEDGGNHFLSSVEVLGRNHSCEIASLPQTRFGLSLARLRNVVIACGGFLNYATYECYTYYPRRNRWIHSANLNSSLMFHSAAGEGSRMYIAGGRRWNHDLERWDFSNETWMYGARARRFRRLPDLNEPMADGCLLALNGDLVYVGGSESKYRYADEPSKAWVLRRGTDTWRDDILGDLLGNRMWPACLSTKIDGEVGILVTGGYYNGKASMFLPLASHLNGRNVQPEWKWFASLPEERKWGVALGRVDGIVTVAGGDNYGDNTIDEYDPTRKVWQRAERKLLHKREFAAYATVPEKWFPQCRF